MSFTPDQIVTMTEILVILMGIGITYAVYYGSDKAELPGEATLPDPMGVDDTTPTSEGRTL